MKLILSLLLTIGAFMNAHARGIPIPVCVPCEKISTIQEFPDSLGIVGDGDEKLNLGYMYKEYGAVFIPVWNSDGVYVLTNEKEDTYYDIDEEYMTELKETLNISIPEGNPLSLWKKIGGKVIIGILLALIIYGQFSPDDEDE